MTNHIVLYEPLIPANTGNIARTCAGTDTVLDLIEPLGFETDDKHLKRAGLDYWDQVKINYHKNLDAFLETVPDRKHLYLITKFAKQAYSDQDVTDTSVDHTLCLVRKQLASQKRLCVKMKISVSAFQCQITFGL